MLTGLNSVELASMNNVELASMNSVELASMNKVQVNDKDILRVCKFSKTQPRPVAKNSTSRLAFFATGLG